MNDYIFKMNLDKNEYDQFVKSHPLCNLLQSPKWAEVKENWKNEILGVYQGDRLIGGASVLIKQLPLNFTMIYIPRGPILDYKNLEILKFFFSHLKKWAKTKHCLFIKMDPGIIYRDFYLEDTVRKIEPNVENEINNLKKIGCIHLGFTTSLSDTIQPRYHAAVKKKDNYLDSLPKHTKRHIKTAKKKNIMVDFYGIEKIHEFSRLMKLTEDRKHISLRNEEYFKHIMNIFKEDCKLFLAQLDLKKLIEDSKKRYVQLEENIQKCKEGQEGKKENFIKERDSIQKDLYNLEKYYKTDGAHPYIASALCIYYGNTCEMLYMGMDGKYQKFHGAYLTHIAPIQYAQENNIEWCNMGGLEGTLDGGLTKFKSNFNPDILEYVGEFDFPINKLLYKPAKKAYEMLKKRNSSD
ncbi:peptidoglycan bridge formation glycyltransferase FemA/FemB family protein [Faecalicoccus acidiformans]|uniref:peptidoglycan bridge formation glycyltransferase FemA/FemB family protein n=1 Tax=Faecalicoccus acidiformans TaxID=915173 RepID=UPI00235526F2|nr:peptidoglycan bridge formation glycyltransferase FemA/FemB family protein [Faecalicoccus acidiformans]